MLKEQTWSWAAENQGSGLSKVDQAKLLYIGYKNLVIGCVFMSLGL
jgi:hypothetical protein